MQVTTERQEKCMVKLTIALDEQEANSYLKRAAQSLSRKYRIPGFRPGKAPYNVVVRRMGIESIQSQALDQFGDEIYQKGLDESKLEPADRASLEDVTWEPLALHLTVAVAPEVELGNYRDIRLPWQVNEVTDQDLQDAMLRMQKEQGEWKPEERPAELGDQIVADITAKVDDEVVLENVGRELVLSAESPYPVPGFAEAVLGMNAGEEREFDLTYPPDHYNADIAGKPAHFVVKLSEIRSESLPALDDEFAVSVGDYESLEDLKTQLRQSLQQNAERDAEEEYETKLWEQLLEAATVEYPDSHVERELDTIKQQLEQQLQQQNLDLATYFRLTGSTEEAWREQVRPQAEERLKRQLILAKVIEDQQIKIETDEIQAEIERIAEPMGERADEMREMLGSPYGMMSVAETLVSRKGIELLKVIARGQAAEQTDQESEVTEESESETLEPETAIQESETADPESVEEPVASAIEAEADNAAQTEAESSATECTIEQGG